MSVVQQYARNDTLFINKWVSFAAAGPLLLASGIAYCFPLWAQVAKQTLKYDQVQIALVGSLSDVGRSLCSIGAGAIFDALPYPRLAPRLLVFVGATLSTSGYMLLWAAICNPGMLQLWQVILTFTVASTGSALLDVPAVTVTVANFPHAKGAVLGLMKAYVGLSASVFSAAYFMLLAFGVAPVHFLLVLALGPLLVTLLMGPLLNQVPFIQQAEDSASCQRLLGRSYWVVLLLALYQGGAALTRTLRPQPPLTLPAQALEAVWAGGAIVLLFGCFWLVWGTGGLYATRGSALTGGSQQHVSTDSVHHMGGTQSNAAAALHDGTVTAAPVSVSGTHGSAGVQTVTAALQDKQLQSAGERLAEPLLPRAAGSTGSRKTLKQAPDVPPLHCLYNLNFWLLFACCTTVCGSGLLLLNNLAQLVMALQGTVRTAGVCASLYSVFNCIGRLLTGYLSEHALHSKGTPRPLFLAGTCLVAAVAAAAAAAAPTPLLLLPVCCLMGTAFGSAWALLPTLTAELFGSRHMAANYCLVAVAPSTGNVLFATWIGGWLYQMAGRWHHDPSTTCVGRDCFGWSLLLGCCCCTVAAGGAFWLTQRTRSVYELQYEDAHSWDEQGGTVL